MRKTSMTVVNFISNWSLANVFILCVCLQACEVNGESGRASSNQLNSGIGNISNNIEWLSKDNLVLLKSNDVFDVRNSLRNISLGRDDSVVTFLTDLWNNRGPYVKEFNKEVLSHPVVRLSIAQYIIRKGGKDDEYFSYIKKHLDSRDTSVKTIAVEALRDVYSKEALSLLRRMVDSEDNNIVDIALSGIKHQTIIGENRGVAGALWDDLKTSNANIKGMMKKYDQMYADYLLEKESRKKMKKFIPANELSDQTR